VTESPTPGQLPVTGGQGPANDGGLPVSLLVAFGLLLMISGGFAWGFGKRR
jgi:hypothetical protein